MFDEALLSERNLEEQLDLELLAGPIAQFGPTERERAIFGEIYFHQRSEHETARQYGIAPRTMRNVARAMRGRLAQIDMEWSDLGLTELTAEWTRLDGLHRLAMQAFADTQEDEPRFKHRRPATDYLLIARRLGSMKLRLGVEIRRRRKLEASRPVAVVRADAGAGGGSRTALMGADSAPMAAADSPSTSPADGGAIRSVRDVRTELLTPAPARPAARRRKILRGRRLRLPGVVGRRPVRGVAAVHRGIAGATNRRIAGPWRCGIPPPLAAESPSAR